MMFSIKRTALALMLGTGLVLPVQLSPVQAQDAAELLLRIDRLEALVRQLNGQVEQASNQNRRLEEQLRRFQSDTDFRFKELEQGRGGARPPAQPPSSPPRPQRGDAFDPNANPQAAGAPQPLGRDPRDPQPLTPQPRVDSGNLPPLGQGTPRQEIARGRTQLENSEFENAEATFREFLRTRPRDALAPEAMMGLGDSFFQRQRWREAAENYVDLVTKFPRSGRAPEADLKLAISLRGLNAVKEACDVLANHGRKHANASNAIKQSVAREMQRNRCAA